MYKVINLYLLASLMLSSSLLATSEEVKDRETSIRKTVDSFGKIDAKEVSVVEKFKQMFTNGKVTGQVRSIFAGYQQKDSSIPDSYATAVGGMLKYELASLHGFNAGFALSTSHDIAFLTGNRDTPKHNPELSSYKGNYSELTEAYINYNDSDFNLRIGRQIIDTPLADSDDIRMVPNTFEALIATYQLNNFNFTAGNVQRWQGSDTGLGYDDNGVARKSNWIDVGPRGTSFVGVDYEDFIRVNAWYYDISKPSNATKASYLEIGSHNNGENFSIHGALQYLHESQSKDSGVQANIYGALVEFMASNIGINLSYNKSKKHAGKRSYSGIGAGSMFTSMDTMIIDTIAEDREAQAVVLGLSYMLDNWEFIYAYGDFDGSANSAGEKAHIVEQNMGFQYTVNEEFIFAAIYVKEEDKESPINTENDWDRLQIMMKYNF